MKTIAEMSTKEILDELNALTGGSVKRFASRADGEKRLAKARGGVIVPQAPTPVTAKAHKAAPAAVEEKPTKAKKEKTTKTPKEKKPRAERDPAKRKASVAASWEDDAVREARSKRFHIIANDKVYRSVGTAFKELGLPMKDHIRFRARLRDATKLTYEHNGAQFKFKLVDKEEYQKLTGNVKEAA